MAEPFLFEIILGRKGIAVTLRIAFDKKNCFHLIGYNICVTVPS